MTETVQETPPGAITNATPQPQIQVKDLNAETVTSMVAGFLKRIGHKGGLKPKRVSLEGEVYTVEVEMKKFSATVKVDKSNQEIKEYDIQPKSEETAASFSPKNLVFMMGVAAVVNVGLYFAFKLMGL
ncbi:MAG: hypothetical protein N3D85_05335 [Candidatus Bathyarchaeota archaeon]|nr:hypothetical protein [Candidatus Bathyarchaeota archaeon]